MSNNLLVNRHAVHQLILAGYSHKAIATSQGISESAVAMVARETSSQRRRNTQYVRLSPDEWASLLKRYRSVDSPTVTELARDYGVSRSSIYTRIKKDCT